MKDIDFLPEHYRQQSAARKDKVWYLVVVVVFGTAIGATALFQHVLKRRALAELAEVEPLYQAAVGENNRLVELQSQLRAASSEMELVAYLRHPWPATQVLRAVVEPLPPELVLLEIELVAGKSANPQTARGSFAAPAKGEAQQQAQLTDAQADLAKLREARDLSPRTITLVGTTHDEHALHRYLAQLSRDELFANVELDEVERLSADGAAPLRFTVQVMLAPSYGQEGGPTQPAPAAGDTAALPAPLRRLP